MLILEVLVVVDVGRPSLGGVGDGLCIFDCFDNFVLISDASRGKTNYLNRR